MLLGQNHSSRRILRHSPQGEVSEMESPLGNRDIFSFIMDFVNDDQYLFVALTSRSCRAYWNGRPTVTRAITPDTTENQMLWSFENGLQRSAVVCSSLARLGRLELLERAWYSGCPLSSRSTTDGAPEGLSVEWAMESGFTWGEEKVGACANAARGGHLKTLQWLRENGCPWNSLTCRFAAEGGHLAVLQWARMNDCPWDARVCEEAAKAGHLGLLQWARANDCPWDSSTCTAAARKGHLDILQWSRTNGCPWDSWTCAGTAQHGHLSILQWLRVNGCSWDGMVCALATQGGYLSVLKWARANGCPWERWECIAIAERHHRRDVHEWILAN